VVSGEGALNIDYKARTVEMMELCLKEGDFISITVVQERFTKAK
jgi:hypothetical protein